MMQIKNLVAEDLECCECGAHTNLYIHKGDSTYHNGVQNNQDHPNEWFTHNLNPVEHVNISVYDCEPWLYIEWLCLECGEMTEIELAPHQYHVEIEDTADKKPDPKKQEIEAKQKQ